MPNLASVLQPLNTLLQPEAKWKWSTGCENAFRKAKEMLTTAPVLAHYDPKLPLQLAGDASAYGMGAVISHLYPDGSERPIAYASRTFTRVRGTTHSWKKRQALLCSEFVSFTNICMVASLRYTLTTSLGSKQGIPPLAAARLQRWALILSGYEYKIVFKSTKAHANADGLSRLPVSTQATADEVDGVSLFNISQIHALPVTAAELQRVTRQDSQLGCVFRYTQNGWPEKVTPDLKPYWFRRTELTVEGGCLMWGIRVVVREVERSCTG